MIRRSAQWPACCVRLGGPAGVVKRIADKNAV